MIPHEFHWIWIGGELPDWVRDNIRMFQRLNPEFGSTLHGEEVLLKDLKTAYAGITGPHEYARKSDLLRLSALILHGGWYLDCDILPIRPLAELYFNYNNFPKHCYVTHGAYSNGKRLIANGVIATTECSPFLQEAHRTILARNPQDTTQWDTYGPRLFTDLVERDPSLAHVGLIDDFYRIQDRSQSMRAYTRIRNAGYTREAVVRELGEPLPFGMHQSQQDETALAT